MTASLHLNRDGSPSEDQSNQNADSNAGITLNVDVKISAESSAKKQQLNANSLADSYSPVNGNSQQPSANSSPEDSSSLTETRRPQQGPHCVIIAIVMPLAKKLFL